MNGLFCIDDVKDADTRDNRQKEAKAQADDEKKADEIGKLKIAPIKVNSLKKKAETDGVPLERIYEKCHVKSLEDLTEKQFSFICASWTKEFVNG